jgi:hypothetical protein
LIVEDFEFGLGEGRRNFILDNLDLDGVADGVAGGVFERVAPANVDADAGVKLEGLAARSRFRVAKHDANLLAQLIGEDAGGFGFGQDGGEFARAWLINRACMPMVAIPISPSNSAFGTSAATESTTITSSALERASVSQMLKASSPLSGWETSRSSKLTPSFLA